MKILVTGGAGFIGSHLTERLMGEHEVMVLDNLSTGSLANVPEGVRFVNADVQDLRNVVGGPWDVIYHCAASYADPNEWESDTRNNVLGTIAVVREAQRTNARIVYFQTSLCYGLNPMSPVPLDAPLAPRGSYAVTKTAAEAFIRDSGVEFTSLRLANMYGPRNLSGPVPAFYKRLSEGRPCTVVDTRRDFVFVGDLVDLAVRVGPGIFHAGSGRDVPIIDVYWAVAAAMGIAAPEPQRMARGHDDVATILLEPSFDTFTTPLSEGIRKAVEWYAGHGVSHTFTHLAMKG